MTEAWPPYEVLMPLAPWEKPAVLAQALDSLAQQDPLPQRLVLSVDGSLSPELEAVVKNHWTLPLQLLCGPGSDGVGLVLARGLEACRCELILRADADDISAPHRVARQIAWIAVHPEVMVGSAWIEEFVDSPKRVVGCRHVPSGRDVMRWALWRNPLNHPAVMFRRSAVQSVGGYRNLRGFEDYDLCLRLLKRYGSTAVNNLPEVLVQARVGPAHLLRRRGLSYARAEASFIYRSARERQIPLGQACIILGLRIPWRLFPAPALVMLMRFMRR